MYLKEQFGEKVYRLSLNGGMTCPNRDGTIGERGCMFCSEGGSGDFASSPLLSITEQITAAKERISGKTKARKFIAYFQAFTNTYAPVSYLRKIYTEAIMQPDIVALSIGTRPDCISDSVLELLSELNQIKPVWIELGLQSMHDCTLLRMRSGFTCGDFKSAVLRLRQANIPVIVHLILGLPYETKDMMLQSIAYISRLPVCGVKLQLLHILKRTDLATMYEAHPFPLFSLEEYAAFAGECIEHLRKDIVVHRITGDGPKRFLIAPLWSADKKNVLNTMNRYFEQNSIEQGRLFVAAADEQFLL